MGEGQSKHLHPINRRGRVMNLLEELYKAPQSYQEDYDHDNGQYMHVCTRCGRDFIGNKHRVLCKECDSGEAEQ